MSPSTSDKIALVMRELHAKREAGEISGEVSTRTMARISREIGTPVSEVTFRRLEKTAMAKLAAAVLRIIESHPTEL